MGAMSALAKAERPQSGTGIPAPHPALIGKYRWVICALLFLGTTVNYVDRQVIGLLKPVLEQQFNWTESDYANIVLDVYKRQLSTERGAAGSGLPQRAGDASGAHHPWA